MTMLHSEHCFTPHSTSPGVGSASATLSQLCYPVRCVIVKIRINHCSGLWREYDHDHGDTATARSTGRWPLHREIRPDALEGCGGRSETLSAPEHP